MKEVYVNWDDHYGSRFEFQFGAYGDTKVVVFEHPEHIEDALETAAEWLKENQPGHFIEPDYKAAQADRDCSCCDPHQPDYCEECVQYAEADLTYTESGWLPSWEWTVDEYKDDRNPYHYVFGSGMVGCLYDYGPNVAETESDAIESLCNVFSDLRHRELILMRHELLENGIYYFRNPEEAGAQYCQVSKEHSPMPRDNDSE